MEICAVGSRKGNYDIPPCERVYSLNGESSSYMYMNLLQLMIGSWASEVPLGLPTYRRDHRSSLPNDGAAAI